MPIRVQEENFAEKMGQQYDVRKNTKDHPVSWKTGSEMTCLGYVMESDAIKCLRESRHARMFRKIAKTILRNYVTRAIAEVRRC